MAERAQDLALRPAAVGERRIIVATNIAETSLTVVSKPLMHQMEIEGNRRAALVNRLQGESLDAPDLHHCRELGGVLARMHRAVADFPLQQPNLRGLPWREATAPVVRCRSPTISNQPTTLQTSAPTDEATGRAREFANHRPGRMMVPQPFANCLESV